jgi:trehalose-phosphatase
VEHLFRDWERVKESIRRGARVLFLADYDGTLTPIVSRPRDAVIDKGVRGLLKRLSKKKKFYVGVISGRELADVRRLVRLDHIYYAGNHGFEIRGPGVSFIHPACKRYSHYLALIEKELASRIKGIKGAIVEHKGASISLHYRLVRKKHIRKLRAIFKNICTPYVKKGKIRLTSGKKVWEVRLPVKWDKGRAVSKALKIVGKKALPIYLGDDKTDEDAFSFLKRKRSITVFVGKNRVKSRAKYYLNSPFEVKRFLVRLCQI